MKTKNSKIDLADLKTTGLKPLAHERWKLQLNCDFLALNLSTLRREHFKQSRLQEGKPGMTILMAE